MPASPLGLRRAKEELKVEGGAEGRVGEGQIGGESFIGQGRGRAVEWQVRSREETSYPSHRMKNGVLTHNVCYDILVYLSSIFGYAIARSLVGPLRWEAVMGIKPSVCLSVVVLLAAFPASSETLTIVRSGAAVDEFLNDNDAHSLSESIFPQGIVLGNGFWEGEPLYRIRIPVHPNGYTYVTSVGITVEGDNAWLSWPDVYVGSMGPYGLDDNIWLQFDPSDYPAIMDAGDELTWVIEVRLDVGLFTERYDLNKITVYCDYANVPSETLENFQEVYGAYRAIEAYEAGMVQSLWNTGEWPTEEYFYRACQETVAFADNLSELSGSLYSSVKGTLDAIENFQNLAGILESAFDYLDFWACYDHPYYGDGPSKVEVSTALIAASDELYALAQAWQDKGFDGGISNQDCLDLRNAIESAREEIDSLSWTLRDVGSGCWRCWTFFEQGEITAEIMLNSLSPLLIDEYYPTYNTFDWDSYVFKLIEALAVQMLGLPVYFADGNLKAAVEEALGLTDPTMEDMIILTQLICESSEISELAGLEYATNLRYLKLDRNQISDISPLAGLSRLYCLYLSGNQISDISPLAGLSRLDYLYLSGNQISDITPLAGLTGLYVLSLVGNQISDISSLEGLENLEYLSLSDNQISDISPLAGLVRLSSYLYLGGNQISDVSPLAGLTNLMRLHLQSNQISDISGLAGLTNLKELWLPYNQVSNIPALPGLTNLTVLELYNNQITDISGIAGLTNLTEVDLDWNHIHDIGCLAELTTLQYVSVERNPLNSAAYCEYLPLIQANNPDIVSLAYDPNPNPLTDDCSTDLLDWAEFVEYWLETDCGTGNNWCGGADLNHVHDVNLEDLAEFASYWLAETGL